MNKKICFFGAGQICKKALTYAENDNMNIDFILDNNSKIWGTDINGLNIKSPEILKDTHVKYCIIVTVGIKNFPEIRKQLIDMNFKENIDFFNYMDVFKISSDNFGKHSGILNILDGFTTVKGVNKNKVIINAEDKRIYRLISTDNCKNSLLVYNTIKENKSLQKYIVKTDLVQEKITDKYPLVYQHEYIPFFSYHLEWTPLMFYNYTLFMTDFLDELDKYGLGLCDIQPSNATFYKGDFLFFDFEAIDAEKTSYYNIKFFINDYVLICLMFSLGLTYKAYMFLNAIQENQIVTIKDICGYLSEEQTKKFQTLYDRCYELSLDNNINECCRLIRNYLLDMKMKFNTKKTGQWIGYQDELYDKSYSDWSYKQKNVVDMVKSVKPTTLLDLAGNMGWYEFTLHNDVEYCITADIDYDCIDFVFNKVRSEGVKNIYPMHLNLVVPTLARYYGGVIGNTAIIPVCKGAIDRCRCEMVLALAIIHHLVFRQLMSFKESVEQFALYTSKYLIIEFVDRNDTIVEPLVKDNKDFDWYTKENFEAELKKVFYIKDINNTHKSRILYLCEKI